MKQSACNPRLGPSGPAVGGALVPGTVLVGPGIGVLAAVGFPSTVVETGLLATGAILGGSLLGGIVVVAIGRGEKHTGTKEQTGSRTERRRPSPF